MDDLVKKDTIAEQISAISILSAFTFSFKCLLIILSLSNKTFYFKPLCYWKGTFKSASPFDSHNISIKASKICLDFQVKEQNPKEDGRCVQVYINYKQQSQNYTAGVIDS